MSLPPPYPDTSRERDQWILAQRGPRQLADTFKPHGFFLEEELSATGTVERVATLLLTNRECPWRCLMCDLWKTTTVETVPDGAIPAQIDFALNELGIQTTPDLTQTDGTSFEPRRRAGALVDNVRQIKLYNGGSFFDPRAIPLNDYSAIAERAAAFERVTVECHPAFVRDGCLRFRDLLSKAARTRSEGASASLEVAMGLETVHPEILERLNKRMTLEQFSRAAEFLRTHGIALRAFVLVKPPFLDEAAALDWAVRSVAFALDQGATAVSLIPTRAGNGALDLLQAQGAFAPPKLVTLERALAQGITLGRGRVFADLWDLERFSECAVCFPARRERLRTMNLQQVIAPPVACPSCGVSSSRAGE